MTRANHWYNEEWCKDSHGVSQEELQKIVSLIRKTCKVVERCEVNSFKTGMICTIYENKNVGVKYWVHDIFGFIESIEELRN